MKEPLQVLHVLGNSRFGGGTVVVLTLADMAREHGLEASILTGDPETQDVCRQRGIGVHPFTGIVRPVRPWRDLRSARALAKELRGRYHVVQTHTTKGGLVGRLAAHQARVPAVIHTVHGFAFHEFTARLPLWILSSMERYLARRCDRLVFVNTHDRLLGESLQIGRPEQRATIYNGVSEDRLTPGESVDRKDLLDELGLPQDVALAVAVGRLAPQKGVRFLLEALADLKKTPTDRPVHLALVGDGEQMDEVLQWRDELDIADRLHVLGFRRDGVRWAGGCDLYVVSSLWEGHSISLLEAMALGRPIVATDIKGNRESIVSGQDGLLVPAGEAKPFADGMRQLLGDPGLADRLGQQARRTFLERFSEETMKAAWWDLYSALLAEKGLLPR